MSRKNYDNDYNDNENEDKENSDEKEDEKLENARYMRMARSKSKKQSKLFTMRKKVNLPKIEVQNNILNEIYKNKKLNGPIHVFEGSDKKFQKPKVYKSKPDFSYIKMYELNNHQTQEYNVFGKEDEIMKDIMLKFKEELKVKRISKITRRRNVLNKLYNITHESEQKMKLAKSTKNLNLEEYQKNILSSVPYNCIGKNEILDLVDTFKTLKNECESVRPFPPINIKIIKDHVKKQNHQKSVKSMRLRDFLNQNDKPKDEFEKEQKEIKHMKCFKFNTKFKRNKNYDILPIHIRESLKKNLKLHL